MKKLPFIFFIACTIHLYAQDGLQGFSSSSYEYTTGTKDPAMVYKPISVIYSRDYCRLSINGVASYFPVDAYRHEVENGVIVEGFVNAETKEIKRGWYLIEIKHNKTNSSEISIQLPSAPGGGLYYIKNAQPYSGQTNGKVKTDDFQDLASREKAARKRFYKWPYYSGAVAPVKIDSFITQKLIEKYKFDEKPRIGTIKASFTIDSTGKVTGKSLMWVIASSNLGFSKSQMLTTPNPGGGYSSMTPVTKEEYEKEILRIISTLPNFEPAVNDKGLPITVYGAGTFILGVEF